MHAPEYLKKIIAAALRQQVSDIHIDPIENESRIRFRRNGFLELHEIVTSTLHQALVLHVKSLARLRSDTHSIPHDGRITHHSTDIRVSIMPVAYGENIVLRILKKNAVLPTFTELGFSESHIALFSEALSFSSGMICIAGPTGSGKTTTLYTLLGQLSRETHAIVTLEDPIEYTIDGVRQIPIAAHKGFTFANGLRAVLRQDPDVIMVGEIRDVETALLAVQAALTGHLVLTTVHASTAEKVIIRLRQLGIPEYLLIETLKLVIAQRLVRCFNNNEVTGRQVVCEMMKPFEGFFAYCSSRLREHGEQLVKEGKTLPLEVDRVLL